MLPKFEVLREMHKGYLVAVVRGKNKDEAVEISKQARAAASLTFKIKHYYSWLVNRQLVL